MSRRCAACSKNRGKFLHNLQRAAAVLRGIIINEDCVLRTVPKFDRERMLFMKKVISLLLAVITVLSCAAYSVSATETTDVNKRRLDIFVYYYSMFFKSYGRPEIYDDNKFYKEYLNAKEVLNNESSTSEDYLSAYETAKNTLYNLKLMQTYAWKSYEKASKLKNVYYPENEWNEFQNTITNLKTALDDNQGIDRYYQDYNEDTGEYDERALYLYTDEQLTEITKRFYGMLYVYNTMSDKYYIMGDVNRDGSVNIFDSVYIQKKRVDLNDIHRFYTNPQKSASDVNGDNWVDTLDAVEIQKYCAGKITEFKPYVSFISKVKTHESEEYIKSHLINFDICPKLGVTTQVALNEEFYLGMYIQEFYTRCENAGIDY